MTDRQMMYEEVSDQMIEAEFAKAEVVYFSARRWNCIQWRSIGFENLSHWLPLTRVLPLVGITPQMLRIVFSPQLSIVKRRFPFNTWIFGLNKNTHKVVWEELPKIIETYEELRGIPLDEKRFSKLAKVLGKTIKVFREDGYSGDHHHVFTVTP